MRNVWHERFKCTELSIEKLTPNKVDRFLLKMRMMQRRKKRRTQAEPGRKLSGKEPEVRKTWNHPV